VTTAIGVRRERLGRLLGRWDDLVDPSVGIVRKVCELRPDDDEPDFFHYLAKACDTGRFAKLSNFRDTGGVSIDRYSAIAKALGEAVERYCSAIFDYRDLTLAPYRELEERAVSPDRFALHSPAQYSSEGFPWRPFGRDSPVCWARGTSMLTDEPTLVPASMVHVPFHFLSSRPDTPIGQPISTGLACGASWEEAALSGLCEAIERDAFTLTWQARMARPRIDQSTLPADVHDRVRRYEDVGLRVELMDITTDIAMPTMMAFAIGDAPTSPAVSVAAATDPCPEIAAIKTLEELAHTRKFSRQVLQCTAPVAVDVEHGHAAVVDQRSHLRFYGPQESRRYAQFAWSSQELRPFPERHSALTGAGTALAHAVATVAKRGLEPIACDLTTSDVRELGLHVARVVVPGLHPLFMGHRNRALGGQRLYSVPQLLGFEGLEHGAPDNPYPHPFP
jgi:ribosomal protein S12 methylthiotransferase accessory factor